MARNNTVSARSVLQHFGGLTRVAFATERVSRFSIAGQQKRDGAGNAKPFFNNNAGCCLHPCRRSPRKLCSSTDPHERNVCASRRRLVVGTGCGTRRL